MYKKWVKNKSFFAGLGFDKFHEAKHGFKNWFFANELHKNKEEKC